MIHYHLRVHDHTKAVAPEYISSLGSLLCNGRGGKGGFQVTPEASGEKWWDGDDVGSSRLQHARVPDPQTPACDSICSVWMCNFLIFIVSSIHLFLLCFLKNINKERKKKSQEINSPKEVWWVIGSYVDVRAAWPRQGTLAASSDPCWPL